MTRQIPPELKGAFPLSFSLLLLHMALQALLFFAAALQLVAAFMGSPFFSLGLLASTLLAAALNGFAMGRALKIRHFLGLFSEWPGLPEEASEIPEIRLLAASARQAFFHGDFPKVPGLVERLGTASPEASLASGRALALAGRFEEALPKLEQGGQSEWTRRYLKPRSWRGLARKPYFSGKELGWILRPWGLLAWAGLALALGLPVLDANYGKLQELLKRRAAQFSDQDFKVAVQGPFTFYYHDAAFMRLSAGIAEDALEQSLRLLRLPPDSFAPGQVKIYLCDSQQEYLSRSPHTRSWEAGSAVPALNQIYVFRSADQGEADYEMLVAHELTHLCYHRAVRNATNDSWLNEGLANYVAFKFALERAHIPRQAWLHENYFKSLKQHALPFEAFLSENPHQLKTEQEIHTFYIQGFSIVYVLIEQYGLEAFLRFIQRLGAGQDLPLALSTTYPTIRDSRELQAVWELFMR